MGASSTLLQIRQFVAQEMGGMGQGGFLSSTATGGSATTLVDTAWPVNTTLSVQDQWQDAWILRPSAALASDKVRLIATYTPNGGTFTVDTAYTNAPTNGEAYEIHTVIEPLTAMTNLINEGLKRCMLETELTLTPVALQQQHLLTTAAPWLEKKPWVRSVGYLVTGENRNQIDPYSRLVRGNAYELDGAIWINHPNHTFLATSTLYIQAMKPAYANCAPSAGSFGAQSGLTLDTDKTPATIEWAGWATIVEAWRRYGQILETGAKQRMIPTRDEAARMFTDKNKDNCRWPVLTFRPLTYGGPRPYSGLPAAYKASTA